MLRVALLMVGLSVHRRLTDRLIIILQSRAIEIGGCKAAPGSGHEWLNHALRARDDTGPSDILIPKAGCV